jgi:hypothetical protein
MFTTVFPPVLTPIPLRQADVIYMYIYIILYIGEVHTAALGGIRRPRQDRGDARGGKSGPLCAKLGECLE